MTEDTKKEEKSSVHPGKAATGLVAVLGGYKIWSSISRFILPTALIVLTIDTVFKIYPGHLGQFKWNIGAIVLIVYVIASRAKETSLGRMIYNGIKYRTASVDSGTAQSIAHEVSTEYGDSVRQLMLTILLMVVLTGAATLSVVSDKNENISDEDVTVTIDVPEQTVKRVQEQNKEPLQP